MEIYILNRDFQMIGMIDNAESIIWHKKYNDIGEAEIYTPCSETLIELLQKGNYLYRYDDDMFCRIDDFKIQTTVENGNYIVATAHDICSILSGRITRWQVTFSGRVAEYLYKLVNENAIAPEQVNRTISNLEFDNSNFSELKATTDSTTVADDLLNLIITTCKAHEYGFRITYIPETEKLVMRLYNGIDKATGENGDYIEFSPEFANINSSEYHATDAAFKNMVYVGYKDRNDNFHMLAHYNTETEPSGDDRHEIYVDGTGTPRTVEESELKQMFSGVTRYDDYYMATVNNERIKVATVEMTTIETEGEEAEVSEIITLTDYAYAMVLRRLAREALSEHRAVESFTGEVDTVSSYQYKVDYDLGDVVMVRNEYGIEAEARITEIIESDDVSNGYIVTPIFDYGN